MLLFYLPSMDLLHFFTRVLVSQAGNTVGILIAHALFMSNAAPTSVSFSSRNSPKCHQDLGRKVLPAWSALTPSAAGAVRFLGGGGL